MIQLRVRTLGELRVLLNDEPVAPLSAKVAGLIVYMAETGETHSRSALAGLMWSDLTEQAARSNLRQALSGLRKALPEHVDARRDVVGLKGQVWIDTRELSGASGPRVAELYRGDFLSGFEAAGAEVFDDWVGGRRAIHRTIAIAALEQEAAAALEEARHHDGILVARRVLEIEPFNEAAHSALIKLFASAGQPVAALAQFETCRHVLREELGTTPAEETQRLAAEVRRLPSARAGAKASSSLGSPPTSFVGRERELQRIGDLIDASECRVLSLVGPGGVGKTRLAVELAARMQADGRDVALVELSGLLAEGPERAADLVVTAIARALEIRLQVQRDPMEFLIDRLAGRRLILVVDNFEHVLGASPVVAALAARLENLRLLVTTRQRLGLGSEWVVEVSGLDYPDEGAGGDLAEWPAVQLFIDRLRLTPDEEAPSDVEAIVLITRLVEGLPLALELAATRARTIPPAEVARRLTTDLGVLASAAADVPQRHRSMRSVLDWSWGLLSRDAQGVLSSCSVFRGPFDLDAVNAIVGSPSLATMDELVAQSLVSSGPRFGLHELVRSYAAGRLAEDRSIEATVRARHARHFAERLQTGSAVEDLADLRSATGWLIEHENPDLLGAHLQRLWDVYRASGAYAEARTVFESALARVDASPSDRSRWHAWAGRAHLQIGRLGDSQRNLADALRLLGTPFPRRRSGLLFKLMGQILRQSSHRLPLGGRRSRDAARRESAIARAEILSLLGETFYLLEDPTPVGLAAVWALNESEVAGEREAAMIGRAETAVVWGAIGWHRAARRYANEAASGEAGDLDKERLARCRMLTMLTWLGLGDWKQLEANGVRALEGARRSRNDRIEEQANLLVAVADLVRGRFESALDRCEHATADPRRRGSSLETQLWGHLVFAEAACRLERPDGARTSGIQAAELAVQTHHRADRARAEAILARVAFARGHYEEALYRLQNVDSIMDGKPAFYPWAIEAHTSLMEIALDLLDQGCLDRVAARPLLNRGRTLAAAYARVFPIARPRLALLDGRAASHEGSHRRARRIWLKGERVAQRLDADWDTDQIRRRLNAAPAAEVSDQMGWR